MNASSSIPSLSRRQFFRSSGAAILGSALADQPDLSAAGEPERETLRVGLIGCGGRGTGAAAQALAADSNVKLFAMGDAFSDRLQGSLEELKKQTEIASKIEVPPERRFVGFDAYEKVIANSDVV